MAPKKILISWIGRSDLKAAKQNDPAEELGPVLRLAQAIAFDEIHLLNDIGKEQYDDAKAVAPDDYTQWLCQQTGIRPQQYDAPRNFRGDYEGAYDFTRDVMLKVRNSFLQAGKEADFSLLLSPGGPACQVSMLLASDVIFHGKVTLYETIAPQDAPPGTTQFWKSVTLPTSMALDLLVNHAQGVKELVERMPLRGKSDPFADFVGASPSVKHVKTYAHIFAVLDDEAVLLTGEPGTGKSTLARCIHKASGRSEGPFVEVNCGAIPEGLLESELFGHVSGAFNDARDRRGKIAEAHGGTLFLDEIGEASSKVQTALLGVLQTGNYARVGSEKREHSDFRLICATNRDLGAELKARRFRDDLYGRIAKHELLVPPIRERGHDVQVLVQHFLDIYNKKYSQSFNQQLTKTFTPAALRRLTKFRFPGNVRDVDRLVSAAWIRSGTSDQIDETHVGILEEGETAVLEKYDSLDDRTLLRELSSMVRTLVERFEGTSSDSAFRRSLVQDLTSQQHSDPQQKKPGAGAKKRASRERGVVEQLLMSMLTGTVLDHVGGSKAEAAEMLAGKKSKLLYDQPWSEWLMHYDWIRDRIADPSTTESGPLAEDAGE